MSRTGLTIGLIISAVLHLWLFRYLPTNASAENVDPDKYTIATVDVVEMEKPQEQAAEKQRANEPLPVQHPPDPSMQFQPEHEYSQRPVEPTRTAELADSNKELLSHSTEPGDFAGSADGIERPILRINWGPTAQAIATLRACDMRLVILTPDGSISHELVPGSAGSWQLRPLVLEAGLRYSDSLRLVGKVPAFASAKAYTRPGSGQSLAVLMPLDMEKMIEATKLTYAYQQGLSMQDITIFGGYFSMNNGNIDFVIDKIELRR